MHNTPFHPQHSSSVGSPAYGNCNIESERPMEAYADRKEHRRISTTESQEELQCVLDSLQVVITDKLLRRLIPVLNADPEGILQDMEKYLSEGKCVSNAAERGVSEINRRTVSQTQQVVVLTTLINTILVNLDLP